MYSKKHFIIVLLNFLFFQFIISMFVLRPQAAMCYVHVAALVAEYLWRKGESSSNLCVCLCADKDKLPSANHWNLIQHLYNPRFIKIF